MKGYGNRLAIPALFLAAVVISAAAYAFENETDGFRGISWGTSIQVLSDMELVRRVERNGADIYKKKNEKMELDGVEVSAIEYIFVDQVFVAARIIVDGYQNYNMVRTAMNYRYGPAPQATMMPEKRIWLGMKTTISLSYLKDEEKGVVYTSSTEMWKKIRQEKKEKMNQFDREGRGF